MIIQILNNPSILKNFLTMSNQMNNSQMLNGHPPNQFHSFVPNGAPGNNIIQNNAGVPPPPPTFIPPPPSGVPPPPSGGPPSSSGKIPPPPNPNAPKSNIKATVKIGGKTYQQLFNELKSILDSELKRNIEKKLIQWKECFNENEIELLDLILKFYTPTIKIMKNKPKLFYERIHFFEQTFSKYEKNIGEDLRIKFNFQIGNIKSNEEQNTLVDTINKVYNERKQKEIEAQQQSHVQELKGDLIQELKTKFKRVDNSSDSSDED